MSRVILTATADEFYNVLDDNRLDVLDVTHLSEELDRLVVRYRNCFQRAPRTNNVTVAAFVTSQARLRLYSFMEEAVARGHQLLYVDTDSIIYKRSRTSPPVQCGNHLGDMVSEMPPERHICEWVCAGPKNYCFEHCRMVDGGDPKTELKIRSFELTCSARRRLNFERIRRLVWEKFGNRRHRGNNANIRRLF